jgi:hypothetical protein
VNECTVAEEEGMVGNDDKSVHLHEIHTALRELIGTSDAEHVAPTKQGGI